MSLPFAHASRITEIEDYFTERTSEFIKHRYPNRPYTVYVKAEADEESTTRNKKIQSTQLPYMDSMEGQTDFWSRKDIPLSTLITYLDSVVIRVDIDANLSQNEINEIHNQMFEYLKLSNASDRIEIRKMDWISNSEAVERRMWIIGGIAAPFVLMLVFFLLTSFGVRSLVKGLSGPITEIGKSTQNFAANALTLASGRTDQSQKNISNSSDGSYGPSNDSNYELRKAFKELVSDNLNLFSQPTPDLIDFLEREGKSSPEAMGSILSMLDRDTLKNLFQFGYGDWWFDALAHHSGPTNEAISILNKVGFLKMRQQFNETSKRPIDARIKDLSLILNRLNSQELETVARQYNLKKILPIFSLLSKEKCMRACKQAYPGEWGSIILDQNVSVPDFEIAQEIQKKALQIKPLRDEKMVENFFVNLDYQRYLDGAHTKDEKEFYRALPESSPLKKRTPFYSIFESGPELLKEITADVALNDWALAMKDCERIDSIKIFDLLSERQRYFLRNMITSTKNGDIILEEKIQAKRRILAVYLEKKNIMELKNKPQDEGYAGAA